eukprot:1356569-Rhodomonas_salina.1
MKDPPPSRVADTKRDRGAVKRKLEAVTEDVPAVPPASADDADQVGRRRRLPRADAEDDDDDEDEGCNDDFEDDDDQVADDDDDDFEDDGSSVIGRASKARLRVHWDTERGGHQLHAIALAASCEINLYKPKRTTSCIVRIIKRINADLGKEEEVKLCKLFYSEDEWSRQALLTVNGVRAILAALIKTFSPFCGANNKEQ